MKSADITLQTIAKDRKDIVRNYNATKLEVLKTKLILIEKLSEVREKQNKLMYWATYVEITGERTQVLEYKDRFTGPAQYEELEKEIYCLDLWVRFGDICTDKNGNQVQVYSIQLENDTKKLREAIKQESSSQLTISCN